MFSFFVSSNFKVSLDSTYPCGGHRRCSGAVLGDNMAVRCWCWSVLVQLVCFGFIAFQVKPTHAETTSFYKYVQTPPYAYDARKDRGGGRASASTCGTTPYKRAAWLWRWASWVAPCSWPPPGATGATGPGPVPRPGPSARSPTASTRTRGFRDLVRDRVRERDTERDLEAVGVGDRLLVRDPLGLLLTLREVLRVALR